MAYSTSPDDAFAVQVRSRRGETIDMSLPLTCTIDELQNYFINEYNYHPSTVLMYNNVPAKPQTFVSSYPYGSLLLSTPGAVHAMPHTTSQSCSYNPQPVRSVQSQPTWAAATPSSATQQASYIYEPLTQDENVFQERVVHPVNASDTAVLAHPTRPLSTSKQTTVSSRTGSTSAWSSSNDTHDGKNVMKKRGRSQSQ